MSLAAHDAKGPLKVLRWSATRWRQMEAIRDRLMHGCGTEEPWFFDAEFYGDAQAYAVAAHWRKPEHRELYLEGLRLAAGEAT